MNGLVDGINRIAEVWWFSVMHVAWQSALIGCVLLALVAWGRRWPSSVRYWLLVIALLKFAVPPLWSAPTGLFSHIAVAERHAATAPAAANAVANAKTEETSATALSPSEFRQRHEPPTEIALQTPSSGGAHHDPIEFAANTGSERRSGQSAARTVTAVSGPSSLSVDSPSLTWKSLLLGLHLLGTAVVFVWVAVQFRSVRRIISRSRSISSGPIAESLGRIHVRLGMRRTARVLLSPDVASPLAAGALRPTVVLPESADGLPPRELDAVLVHELTHLRRGDAWLAWAQVLMCAVWWFHPVIWLVNRSLRRVREDCCDDAILLSGVATESEYCDILLRVARDSTARHADLLACHMAGRLHPLGDRMRRIMDARVRRWRRTPWAVAAAVVVLACVALPGLGRHAGQGIAAPSAVQVADRGAADTASSNKKGPTTKQSAGSAKGEKRATTATAGVPPVTDPFAQQLKAAISRGRSSLAGAQNPDGSFVVGQATNDGPLNFAPGARPPETGNSPSYSIGATSLAVLALLGAGEKPDAPVITKSLDFLRNAPATASYFSTYENSLEIAALVAANTGDRDRGRITALVRSLEKDQIRSGSRAGMWNYGQRDKGGEGDNSNTQFALFGLHAAAAAGIPIKRETWERSSDHFVHFQNKDGGWGYRNGNSSTGSMTCGAIASLALCDQILAAGRSPDGQITPGDGDEKKSGRDRALQRGIEWMSRYFIIGINPGQRSQWVLYYLFEMSRAGRLSGRARFGAHDWYREGAAYLVEGQSVRDGSWEAWGGLESDKRLATSFALLFLCAAPGSDQSNKVSDDPPRERNSLPNKSGASGVASSSSGQKPSGKANQESNRFEGKLYLLQPHKVHISGQATNEKGEPVALATARVIANNRYELPKPVLATVKTDADGKYDLPELSLPVLEFPPQPFAQHTEGKFQIVATAPSYGYTWRRSMTFRPGPRPATAETGTTDRAALFYEGEPIHVDLHFAPEARVHGRITNDFGEPLKGAQIEFGVIRDVRRDDSPEHVSWRCVYLPGGLFAAEGTCNVVRYLPREFLSTHTDGGGRYEMRGLPREAGFIAQIEYGGDYIAHSLTLQTTKGSSDKRTARVGYDGEWNYVFPAPREIRVRVTEGRSGKPVAGVAVRGRGRSIQWSGTEATTGGDGVAMLRLAPGKYTLIAEPPSTVPLVRATKDLNVQKPRRQDVGFSLDRAAVALIKAVDTATGKPVEGAAVFFEEEGVAGATRLQSQTVFIDNPMTDAGGNLRAFVPSGRRRFFAQRDPGVAGSQRPVSQWFALSPEKETIITLTLPPEPNQEPAKPRPAAGLSAAQQAYERVRERWHRQWLLCCRGRYRIRIHNHLQGSVSHERLVELLRSCDGKNPGECLAILSTAFPDLPGSLGRAELILDNARVRDVSWPSKNPAPEGSRAPLSICVFNGQETIFYWRPNAQVDIYGLDNAEIGFRGPQDLFNWPGASARISRVAASGDRWKGTMTAEKDRLRFTTEPPAGNPPNGSGPVNETVVDEATGFVDRQRVDLPEWQYALEDWQFGPKRQPNGAVVPSVHFHAEYLKQKLSAKLVLIDEVELMDRVPPESFVVAVPPGTLIFDHRGIPRAQMSSNWRPRSTVVTEPVGDVVARANGFRNRKPPVLKRGDQAPPLGVAKWVAGTGAGAAPSIDGRIVLVNFSAHWCSFCRPDWAQLEAASRLFAKDDVRVVGIYDCGDSESDVKRDVEKAKLTYNIGLDSSARPRGSFGGKTFKAYGIDAVPESAVIGRDGRIAYIGRLDQALETVDRLVKAK